MTKKKGIICLFGTLLLLTTTLLLAVGTGNARISSAFSQKVIFSSPKAELESNYLSKGGQTVVLDDRSIGNSETVTETITLSSPVPISGTLDCVSNSSLVTATLDKTSLTVNKTATSVTLSLKQTAEAANYNKRASIIVCVTWTPAEGGETEWANFVFDLLPDTGLVYDETVGLESNYLVDGGQTVYLGALVLDSSYITKDIELTAYTGSISGELECSSDSEFVTALLDATNIHQHITVDSKQKYISVLKISGADTQTPITQKTAVTVRVSWTPDSVIKETKWVDFTFELLPANSDVQQVTASEKPAVTIAALPSASFDSSKPVRIDFTCSQETDTLEISYNGGEFPEWTRYSADGEEYVTLGAAMKISLPVENGQPNSVYLDFSQIAATEPIALSLVAYNAQAASDPAAVTLTPVAPAVTDQPLFGDNSYIANVSPDELFYVDITVPSNAKSVEITYNGGDFPKGTRYSLNNKKFTYHQTARKITLSVKGNQNIRLYFDLSNVKSELITQTLTLGAAAYAEVAEIKRQEITIQAGIQALEVKYDPNAMIIGEASRLTLDATGGTERVAITVEKLVKTEDQTQYVTDPENFGITVWIEDGKLMIANDSANAKAGSYRLTLTRSYGEFEQKRIEIPFFIHY
ncbi:MAG: hypothetical protein IJC50_08465 [Clostridia bacterium]|nr:hypothetical protein [Clostridia bacterium]